jgi:hypothetical protein
MNYKIKSLTTIFVLSLVALFVITTQTSFAQSGGGSSNSVPIDTSSDYNISAQHDQDYYLNEVAWSSAKIIVQQITGSTVKWINGGFKGGPAFVTNPSSFFANIGDQITGSFIAGNGALSSLCSPFNVNVRLSLGLQQAGYGGTNGARNSKYTCTLDSIIKNISNPTVNGKSITGNSSTGFLNGDFNQGGWAGFMALSQPNNNSSGVYLQAQDDLNQQISTRQDQQQQQLNQGGGFLTYPICTNLGSDGAAAYASGNPNVTATAGPGGKMTYQSCQDSTPGSVINSVLQKNVNSGVDQLNIAQSMDQIISSTMSQLTSQILTQGLTGVNKNSGVTKSYIDQLSNETTGSSSYSRSTNNLKSGYNKYITTAQNTADTYTKIIGLFDSARTSLLGAETCYTNLASSSGQSETSNISNINSTIAQLNADEAPYLTSYNNASSSLASYQNTINNALNNVTDPTQLTNASQSYQDFVSNQVPAINTASQNAKADLSSAQTTTKAYQKQATQYLNQCHAAGGN